jgi:glycosyltransferase involved in cell wall biosynthesis
MGPLVSIVTPSYQSGRFLERAIESVLSQDYSPIEYIVMDAGSTDGSVGILERYRGRLTYVTAADGGAADAINRGFRKSTGSIFAWLNADDLYFPGAVRAAVKHLEDLPGVDVVYGNGVWVDEAGDGIGPYPTLSPFTADALRRECGICQPAAFMRREAFAAAGMLDPDLHFAFDYDLWIRLSRDRRFHAMPETMAASRMHRANKSLGGRRKVFEENMAVLRRHYGYVPLNWIYGYQVFLRDGRDQFFEPLRHSAAAYLESLAVGLRYNSRHPFRFVQEWASRLIRRSLSVSH